MTAAALVGLTACGSTHAPSPAAPTPNAGTTTATSPSGATPTITDWPTYHGSNDRRGDADVAALTAPLRRAWSLAVDGALYAQPLVVHGVAIVATENDSVYAVDVATGAVRWRRHLGTPTPRSQLPCGNIDPSGITGTPAYDTTTRQLFVATESGDAHHTLFGLDAATGAVRWKRDLDVLSTRDRHAEQQRGAALVASGHVYIPFGGRDGDCGNYVGYLASVAATGDGAVTMYAVPTAREAGMWAPPGAATGPGGGVYVATGNGAEVGGHYDDSDSVLRLTPTLHRIALFAPASWSADNARDLDLGSMSPALVGTDVVIAGKRGDVYLLRGSLGGVGGQVATLGGCAAYGGAAVHVDIVVLPCSGGLRAMQVGGSSLRWRWHNSSLSGSPVLVRGAGYAFDDNGNLVEFDLGTGHARAHVHVGDVTRFTTPVPAGRYVIVGTTSRLVAVTAGG